MSTIATWTDYRILNPDFFIDHIQNEINKRDLPGLTGSKIKGLHITGEHPLVSLTSSILQNNEANMGLIPAISVMADNEDEEGKANVLGHGLRGYDQLNQAWLDDISTYGQMQNRYKDGLITDSQIATIQTALETYGQLPIKVEEYFLRDGVIISLWTHSTQELQILSSLLRSIIYDMKHEMLNKGLTDLAIRTDRGLVNYNFGKMLFGQETSIGFMNGFRNFSVLGEEPLPEDVNVYGNYTEIVTGNSTQIHSEE